MVKRIFLPFLLVSLIFFTSCQEATPPDDQPVVSPVPVPGSVDDPAFPMVSEEVTLGISQPISDYTPIVTEWKDWDGTYDNGLRNFVWFPQNERKVLVQDGEFQYHGWNTTIHLYQAPHIKHTQYWKRLFSVKLDGNTEYSESHSVTYGISETKGQEFSVSIGIEISAWFVNLSAEISQTSSYEITHSSETNTTKTFTCQGTAGKITVFSVWQRIDRFYICDADGKTVAANPEALSGTIRLGSDDSWFEERNESNFYLSAVLF